MRWHLLVVWFFCASAVAMGKASDTVGFDVTALVQQSNLRLLGGRTVHLHATLRANDQVVFEDRLPGANWAHPAQIRVLDAQGAVIETIDTTMPPEELGTMRQLWGRPLAVPRVAFNVNDFGGKYKVANPDQYWAVLINGRAMDRHWNDFSFLYRVLTKVYGYRKDHILVGDSTNKTANPDLDGDGQSDIDYGSTKADVQTIMQKMAATLTGNDHFLLVINDHGDRQDNVSSIVLADGEMPVGDFAALLGAVKAGKVLSLYEQCFSGGFVRPSVNGSRVAMSAAKDTESSYASMDGNFDEWIYYVIAAFARQDHMGNAVDVPMTTDGHISAKQAFSFAIMKDKQPESPLLEAKDNDGDADNIGVDY